MKRSDLYIRIITAVLFLAVASYIGVYIYNATISTFVTTAAVSFSVEETIPANGYIVRTETALEDAGATILPIVGDGEKVASGQAIAVEYLSRGALETASQLRALKMRIAHIESSDDDAAEAARAACITELSQAVRRGDLGGLDELTMKIETNIFTDGASSKLELPSLYARLESLESRVEGVRTIYAPASGTFSHVVDGFESISPGDISNILPSRLTGLFSAPTGASGLGKLVTEFKWFFAAIMDADDAARLMAGRNASVRFSGAYNEILEMLVENVGKREDGRCVVLFSSDRGIHQVAPLRYLRADVVTGTVTGIRVPKEAIRLDDDAVTYIFLQTGVRAERVNIEILKETGEAYLVRDGAETGAPLRAGSTIIVKANGLYDGKIVG